MYCSECGKPISDDSKFCEHCGAPIQQIPVRPAAADPFSEAPSAPDTRPPAGFHAPESFDSGERPAPSTPAPPVCEPQRTFDPQPAPEPQSNPAYGAAFGYTAEQASEAPQGFAPQGFAPQPTSPQPYAPQPEYNPFQAQYGYAQPPVVVAPMYQPPARRLKTNRKLWKYILLDFVTFGIYSIVFFSNISTSINTAASRYDGRKTMHFCLVLFVFSWLTLGIVPLIWFSRMSRRIGNELQRRGIQYGFGASTFWLWDILGSLIVCGPFIYIHKLAKAMNLVCENYNMRG